MRLLNFIKAIFSKEIPRKIGNEEFDIVRCVIHPMHFDKKDNLYFYCFTPPKKKKDTSLIRLSYTNENIAKKNGIDLSRALTKPNKLNHFKGLAVVNNDLLEKLNSSSDLKAKIKGTPIDIHDQYIIEDRTVYKCDKGKPYHADMIFSKEVPDGEPATQHRKYNEGLVNLIKEHNLFFKDTCPNSDKWCGSKIMSIIQSIFIS